MKFLEAFANVFRIPDLRKRVLFTLGLLAVYRLGGHVPIPGINSLKWDELFSRQNGGIFQFFDMFAGGNIRRLTVFALGIMPYITSSIILQLLTVVVPTLEKLSKEGELGRRKITQWTRYLTVILALIQSFIGAQGLQAMEGNIVHEWNALMLIIIIAMMIAVVAFIVLVERGERRIPVQYAKRVIGRRVMGGQSTHMPLKVNAGGVIPVIFASSILAFPQTLAPMPWVKNNAWLSAMLADIRSGEPLYVLLFVSAIVFFCFFYISIIFNPHETADNMRKYGGFIPGIRPGRNTADYMNNILSKITVVGGLYLAILCLIPDVMLHGIKLQHLWLVGNFIDAHFPRILLDGLNVQFYFGGTSLLIVVGVAMDTVNQIEAQLIMRHYEGFTPRAGRIRGRRSSV